MAAAAKNLTSVTLELGGKSPVIVDKSANLKKAARSIAYGKFSNNGQTCIAPDYIYAHESIKDALVAEITAAAQKQYGLGNDAANNDDYCRIVNAAHHGRITRLLDDAKASGAVVLTGGETNKRPSLSRPH